MNLTRLAELARAAAAGLAATAVDLATLWAFVALAGWDARGASVPALLAGGVANFVGNRHFAFRAARGSLARQALGYTVVELGALALNGLLYDAALRVAPGLAHLYWAVRLITTHLVFLTWSYPLWRRVFRAATLAPCEERSPSASP
jgi:putative flippase GtrA